MVRVGRFDFVSMEQFARDIRGSYDFTDDMIQDSYPPDKPRRATTGSAGYDIRTPYDFTLAPGASIKLFTGLRVQIEDGWYLSIVPRSSLGFKYHLRLDNTIGIIDSDYYNADNSGHFIIKMTNGSNEDKIFYAKKGDAIAQAIFLPYGITYDDCAVDIRTGGFGSTGR